MSQFAQGLSVAVMMVDQGGGQTKGIPSFEGESGGSERGKEGDRSRGSMGEVPNGRYLVQGWSLASDMWCVRTDRGGEERVGDM